MRDFTRPEPESSSGETDESGFEGVGFWQCRTCSYEELDFAVGENVFVGLSGCECLSVTGGPLSGRLVVMRHA